MGRLFIGADGRCINNVDTPRVLRKIELRKVFIMEVIVKKWGNSVAVRIVIEPMCRKSYKLDELLDGITAKNQHKPVETGAPVGKEVW